MVEIWTDGACQPNPGAGGWAWIARYGDGRETKGFGAHPATTNNRMELAAILGALLSLVQGEVATVFTDSKACIGWLQEGWKRNDPQIREATQAIDVVVFERALMIRYEFVKGHSGDEMNERVDAIATAAAAGKRVIPEFPAVMSAAHFNEQRALALTPGLGSPP